MVVATLGEMMRDRGAGALEWVDEDHAVSENGLVGVVMVHDERSAAPVANAAESLAEELGVERVVVVLCGENNTEVFDERELMLNPTQHVCSPRFKVLVPREVDEKVARYGELQNFPKMLRTESIASHYSCGPNLRYFCDKNFGRGPGHVLPAEIR